MSRAVSSPLLAHFRSRYRTLATCWVIRPRVGPIEAYCSLDRNLVLPAFNVGTALETPALTYLCAGGVESTTIPARLNLSKAGVEVAVLAFDRERLIKGYYRDAQFEAFIVNYADPTQGRDVRLSGKVGNIEVGPVGANIELITWAALSEMQQGRTCNQLCDVGCFPGEGFGTPGGRCRNATLNDGPLRANWSVLATITAVASAHQFTVSHGTTAISGAALPSGFDAHLEAGDVEFDSDSGGTNAGVALQIKSAASGVITLHQDLPFVPSVGDELVIVAGCRRTVADCTFFENMPNYRGFNLLPGKIGVLNEKTEES
ncbi:DUF2163 domain-containing protein [bacterium]|nr:MAG: DUF2163 domain-containing protein [bacterium]